jgi:hypothetical protein
MRPHQFRHRVGKHTFFTSCKCETAVPVDARLLRYALEEAALDPAVRAIHYRTGPTIECPPASLRGVVLDRTDGRYLLRVYETRPQRSNEEMIRFIYALECHGLQLLERDTSDVLREPLFTNVRAVWSYAGYHVSIRDRLRISLALADGPQTLLELEERARASCDIVAAVCALACLDLVSIDLGEDLLGPRTIVCCR